MNFFDRLEEIRKDNSKINQLKRIKRIISSRKIKENIVLSKMKRDGWNVDAKNKYILASACENSINIVLACLYPSELLDLEEGK